MLLVRLAWCVGHVVTKLILELDALTSAKPSTLYRLVSAQSNTSERD
jgi:hypothetical protein